MNGFLLIDKPPKLTSHAVVARVRRMSGIKRVGHAGTLDPMATGVLVVAVGQATRLNEYLLGCDKHYLATLRLGETTASYDADTPVLTQQAVTTTQAEFEGALAGFVGNILQTPPAYSAIKQAGQPVYKKARLGQPVTLNPRPIEIYSLKLVKWQPPEVSIAVHCGSGTYIRSLAHDLGQTLGCGAHLVALSRTMVGPFALADCDSLEHLAEKFAAGLGHTALLSMAAALPDWPVVMVDGTEAARLRMGQKLPISPPGSGLARACLENGDLVAIVRADVERGAWHPEKAFGVE